MLVALVILVVWFVQPLLTWLTTQYVFTNRRIITRTGIIARSGKDMPLSKLNDVLVPVHGGRADLRAAAR